MYTEAQKIGLIERVIKTNDNSKLLQIESILNSTPTKKKTITKKKSIYDYVGILDKKQSEEIKKVIKDTCEVIHEDDWK